MKCRFLSHFLLVMVACGSVVRAEELRLESVPAGAKVSIDGKDVGVTPLVLKLPGGYFHSTKTAFGARLGHPVHATFELAGYITQEIDLTYGPMEWIAINGVDHGPYYLLKDKLFAVTLVAESKVFKLPLPAAPPQQFQTISAEMPLETLVDRTSSSVLKISTDEGWGSGFLVTQDGIVITNAHVVGNSSQVTATNLEKQQFNGTVAYRDPGLDLAIVKLNVPSTPYLPLAQQERVGESVIAIGNPGLGMQNTVTKGIVSAVGPYPDLGPGTWVQTDASINPGNSGGPLLDMHGEVVGMNTVKVVKADVQGLGFALSAQDILAAIQHLFPAGAQSPAPAMPGKGRVMIVSTASDADVYVDGKYVGNAPSSIPIGAGDHTIEVKAPGFADWKRTISVSDGSDLNLKANLQPQ